jgi:K+-sensing histidine kinase KdpD
VNDKTETYEFPKVKQDPQTVYQTIRTIIAEHPSAIRRYGLAILSVAIALGVGLLSASLHVQGVEFPRFLIAIAITVWYAGKWPGILALVLSTLAFNYHFTGPLHSFYVTLSDLPYYAVLILFELLITWFTALRRRIERNEHHPICLLFTASDLDLGLRA